MIAILPFFFESSRGCVSNIREHPPFVGTSTSHCPESLLPGFLVVIFKQRKLTRTVFVCKTSLGNCGSLAEDVIRQTPSGSPNICLGQRISSSIAKSRIVLVIRGPPRLSFVKTPMSPRTQRTTFSPVKTPCPRNQRTSSSSA